MKPEKNNSRRKPEIPDALGNDKRQGEDMPRAGHAEKVYVEYEENNREAAKPSSSKNDTNDPIQES